MEDETAYHLIEALNNFGSKVDSFCEHVKKMEQACELLYEGVQKLNPDASGLNETLFLAKKIQESFRFDVEGLEKVQKKFSESLEKH